MGIPFDDSREKICPVYKMLRDYLEARGWVKKHYHAENVHNGGMCIFRYEFIGHIESENIEILYKLEATIRGTETTCTVNVVIDSYDPKNRFVSLNHDSEFAHLESLVGLLRKFGTLAS